VQRQFVAYYRVSTQRQGASGLGLQAQQTAVADYLARVSGHQLAAFEEIESGKGADALDRRPQLRAALDMCRRSGACLLIAKLDRLARNVYFVSGLLETGVDFVAADMPEANKVMIQIYSVMAEFERDQISARTKAALAAAKARGVVLGAAGARNLRPNTEARREAGNALAARLRGQIEGFRMRGLSQRAMVVELNSLGVKAPRGGEWSLSQFQRLLKRADGERTRSEGRMPCHAN
jgi:DNA invertase Pin-like site-specific DNA recombinase